MRALVTLVAAVMLGACVPLFGSVSIDYVDFVKWNGVEYWSSHAMVGRQIADTDLGPERFRVTQTLVTANRGMSYRIADGDSAFVPAGDPVYTVRGYAPWFRLAARHNGELVLYEARIAPSAKQGRDLFDIEGKVSAIAILDQKSGTRVIGRISEPSRVDALVSLVLEAPVGGPAPILSAAPGSRDDRGVRPPPTSATVSFELKDGTAVVRAYEPSRGALANDVMVAGAFRDAIGALLANAPTPTPAPAAVNLTRRYELAQAQSVMIKRPDRPGAQPVLSVTEWSSAVDRDMPALRAADPSRQGDIAVIFSFADRYVSLVYDRATGMIRVAVPDDELEVQATDTFRTLLDRR
jgi:hypothetical protein